MQMTMQGTLRSTDANLFQLSTKHIVYMPLGSGGVPMLRIRVFKRLTYLCSYLLIHFFKGLNTSLASGGCYIIFSFIFTVTCQKQRHKLNQAHVKSKLLQICTDIATLSVYQ